MAHPYHYDANAAWTADYAVPAPVRPAWYNTWRPNALMVSLAVAGLVAVWIALVVVGVIVAYFRFLPANRPWLKVSLGLQLGGALGRGDRRGARAEPYAAARPPHRGALRGRHPRPGGADACARFVSFAAVASRVLCLRLSPADRAAPAARTPERRCSKTKRRC